MIALNEFDLHKSLVDFGWIYFLLGNVLLMGYCSIENILTFDSLKSTPTDYYWILAYFVPGVLRSVGGWLILIGNLGVAGKLMTYYPEVLKNLVEMAMPFYLNHMQILVSKKSKNLKSL